MDLDLEDADMRTLQQQFNAGLQQQKAASEAAWRRRLRAMQRWGLPALIGLVAAILGHLLVGGYQHWKADHDLLHTLVNIEVQRRQPTPTLPTPEQK